LDKDIGPLAFRQTCYKIAVGCYKERRTKEGSDDSNEPPIPEEFVNKLKLALHQFYLQTRFGRIQLFP
jgi:hypothetical protein